MTMPQPDLFGERRIKIEGNLLLEGIANHILDLYSKDPELLNGDSVGEINRKVTLAIYFDNGLLQVLQSGAKEQFIEWFMNKKLAHTEEEIARALRYLVQNDYLRLPSKALIDAERHRQRIARSVK
jgi:hypothetical protein